MPKLVELPQWQQDLRPAAPQDYEVGAPAGKRALDGRHPRLSFRARWFLRAAVRRIGDATGRHAETSTVRTGNLLGERLRSPLGDLLPRPHWSDGKVIGVSGLFSSVPTVALKHSDAFGSNRQPRAKKSVAVLTGELTNRHAVAPMGLFLWRLQ